MKILNIIASVVITLASSLSFACGPSNGEFSVDLKINSRPIGTLSTLISDNKNEITLSLSDGLALASQGTAFIAYGEGNIIYKGRFRYDGTKYVIADRSLGEGEKIAFIVTNGLKKSVISVVKGVFGSTPRGCSNPLEQSLN